MSVQVIYHAATNDELLRILSNDSANRTPALHPATNAELLRILARTVDTCASDVV